MRSRSGCRGVLPVVVAVAACGALAAPTTTRSDDPAPAARVAVPDTGLQETERILHLLNRVAYGPRPGDVERVREQGIESYLERQLQEVMTDYWFNHFNVYIGKGADRWSTPSYEYDAIRPHVLGRFRDLLGATARHPAMLFYLDGWLSAAPGSTASSSTRAATWR